MTASMLGRLIAAICGLLMLPGAAAAQSTWTYGGFADLAYLFAPNGPSAEQFRSRGTAWHLNGIYLNMAGVYARRPATSSSRWGGELTLHTGKDDELFGFSATAPNIRGDEWLRHLGPTSISYHVDAGNGLTVQAGIFSSLIGYDSLYARDSISYTRPWGADFTPYLMLGVNASYPITEKLTVTGLAVNGYWHLAAANSVPSSGVQIAYAFAPNLLLKQTVMVGPHQADTAPGHWRVIADTIVERRRERFVAAFNYHFATERVDQAEPLRAWWMAAQLPMQWQLGQAWRLSVRPEAAWDSNGRWTLAEQTVTALTTTLEYRAALKAFGASLRLEHRVDRSTGPQGGFFTDRAPANGARVLTPTQHLIIAAMVLRLDGSR